MTVDKKNKFSTPFQAKHPQTLICPPSCLTVGTVHTGFYSFLGDRHTITFLSDPKRLNFGWSDHKTCFQKFLFNFLMYRWCWFSTILFNFPLNGLIDTGGDLSLWTMTKNISNAFCFLIFGDYGMNCICWTNKFSCYLIFWIIILKMFYSKLVKFKRMLFFLGAMSFIPVKNFQNVFI